MTEDNDAFNIKLLLEQEAITYEHAMLPFPFGFIARYCRSN